MSVLIKGGRIGTAVDDYVADVIGAPEVVLVRGQVIVEGDELVAAPGAGQFVRRARFGESLSPRQRAAA